MTARDNEDLLHRYIEEVWNQDDPDAVERFLDVSYQRHISPSRPPLGRDEQIVRLRSLRTAFPDIRLTVEDVVASGDLVWFRGTMRGTHLGELLGLAPTGAEVTVGLIDIWRVVDGRVVEHWGGPDMFDLFRQLGATFSPAA